MYKISRLNLETAQAALPQLAALLQDATNNNASVGFLAPLGESEALKYWTGVLNTMQNDGRVLLVAKEYFWVIGTVQLDICNKPNGLHRAEVVKLLVHSKARRRGVARALMQAIESEAQYLKRSTLVLDTRKGDVSELLYQSLGWQFAGEIPQFCQSNNGNLDSTMVYYKLI